MSDYPGPNRVGVAVEHCPQHFEFIFDFRCFGSVVGNFALTLMPAVVAEAETGMSVAHPITESFDSAPDTIFFLRQGATDLVGVITHEAIAMELEELFEIGGKGIEQRAEIALFFGIKGKDELAIVSPPHFVEDAGGRESTNSGNAHAGRSIKVGAKLKKS